MNVYELSTGGGVQIAVVIAETMPEALEVAKASGGYDMARIQQVRQVNKMEPAIVGDSAAKRELTYQEMGIKSRTTVEQELGVDPAEVKRLYETERKEDQTAITQGLREKHGHKDPGDYEVGEGFITKATTPKVYGKGTSFEFPNAKPDWKDQATLDKVRDRCRATLKSYTAKEHTEDLSSPECAEWHKKYGETAKSLFGKTIEVPHPNEGGSTPDAAPQGLFESNDSVVTVPDNTVVNAEDWCLKDANIGYSEVCEVTVEDGMISDVRSVSGTWITDEVDDGIMSWTSSGSPQAGDPDDEDDGLDEYQRIEGLHEGPGYSEPEPTPQCEPLTQQDRDFVASVQEPKALIKHNCICPKEVWLNGGCKCGGV